MRPHDWQKVKSILDTALERAPSFRSTYIADACAGDEELRIRVSELLSSYNTDFLEIDNDDHQGRDESKLKPGEMIGRYDVISLIGSGGMGEVYLAKDNKLDRKVAIKVHNDTYKSQEENVQQFIKEAKAASALNHPISSSSALMSELKLLHERRMTEFK